MYTVPKILNRLNAMLPSNSWHVTGAARTIRGEYLPASEAIASSYGIDVSAQFWLSSPVKWLKFEIAGGGAECSAVRDQVASDLRRYLVGMGLPEFVVLASGSTVCRLSVGSGDKSVASDEALESFIAFLRDHVRTWAATKGEARSTEAK